MKNFTRHFTSFFILLTVILIGTSAFRNKNSDLREFKIEFESTKNGLNLIGLKGTAFKEISFTLKDNVQRSIDEFGVTIKETKATANANDNGLADFEFTIKKVNEEYVLVGKKGAAWTRLSFTFSENNKAIVDQNGVKVN